MSRISAAGGVDRRELARQSLMSRGIGGAITLRGANDADARPEHDDTGEKEQRFAFGGCRHGGNDSAVHRQACHRSVPPQSLFTPDLAIFLPSVRNECERLNGTTYRA